MATVKAQNYLTLLEAARCEGNWESVPELVRKVRKHAPERVCLTLTAETEAQIAKATQATSDSGSAVDTQQIAQQLPKLVEIIESESTYPQDRFQATVCAGWLHWVIGEYSQATARLPAHIDQEYPQLANPSEWSTVCALKAAYLKGNCAARTSQPLEALAVFETGLSAMDGVWGADKQPRRQLRYWTELFLSEYSMLSSQVLGREEKPLHDANALAGFRSWSRYWESLTGPVVGGQGFRGSVPRRRIWYEYYLALSNIVELDVPFSVDHLAAGPNKVQVTPRNALRMELKKAESAYEALLLDETQFPKANEEREEVEDFVQRVMKNWQIMCGRGWTDADLGQGGRENISRGVLDILYRAATKTYQSTSILRHLMTVHLAVAEFDLAFKSLDAYMEVVKKAKARVDKTGIIEPSLDDDATVLETMGQAISGLCRYGGPAAIEKAHGIARELEDTMAHLPQLQPVSEGATPVELMEPSALHPPISGETLAFAWQAIGLANASWARVTADAAARPDFQAKAIRSLRKSLSPAFGRSRDVQSLYSLGLLLAERRDIGSAIEVVKAALAAVKPKEPDSTLVLMHGPYWQERALIPVWHLLALLLSARQDFVMAARACEGAFEQFKDLAVLFGNQEMFRSEHLQEQQPALGLVDSIDDAEREAILEVKMTQLALVELLEGPEVAVNASYELLTLYSRLFGSTSASATASATATAAGAKGMLEPPSAPAPPKSSAGTIRSFRGSFFGNRGAKTPSPALGSTLSAETAVDSVSRPLSTLTVSPLPVASALSSPTGNSAPAIQVVSAGDAAQAALGSGRASRRSSLRKRDPSVQRRASSMGAQHRNSSANVPDGEAFFSPEGDASADAFALSGHRQPSIATSFTRRHAGGSGGGGGGGGALDAFIASKSKTAAAAAAEQLADHAADGTFSLPVPLPPVVFAADEQKRQRTVILVKLWLMVAGFYRRAEMVEDAAGAVAEAQKLVQSLEADLARDATGSLILKAPQWAEKKSVDELWGDVWAERGNASLANDRPLAAREEFETALTYFPDHAAGITGLSNILLDIYTEDVIPGAPPTDAVATKPAALLNEPLGLGPDRPVAPSAVSDAASTTETASSAELFKPVSALPHVHSAPEPRTAGLLLVDRLAARDRAYGLLAALTKRGAGWNNSEAWFALARAYEHSGQPDKAKEVLWWCVDLEEGRAIREWGVLGDNSYAL